MSNISLFQNSNQLPAHLRRGELSETTKSLMGGGSNKRISIEGGAFRMLVGGQEVSVIDDRFLNVIVVRAADHNSRTFYEGTYVKGAKAKPACWSDDAVTPHEDVKSPQSSKCQTCPQNIKGSGANADSRACRYQRRLAVVLENDVQGDIYAMSIPAASLFDQGEGRKMGLQQYARFLGGHGVDVNAVVTEMRFDTNATAPKLTFSATRPLEEGEYDSIRMRKDEPAAIDAVTMTVGQLDEATTEAPKAQQKAQEPLYPAQAPAPAPVQAPTPKPKPRLTPQASGFKVESDTPVSPAATPVEEPTVRETPKQAVPNINAMLNEWGGDLDD
jgi:hypothetical protein